METNNTSTIANASKILNTALPYPCPIVFVFLYSVTAVLSIVGNILVVIVLIVQKRLTKGVRYSLVNLAVADFIMAVTSLPASCINQVYGQWHLPSALCTIAVFVEDVMQVVSVLTITAIGIDRYFAILFPLKFRWLRSDCAIITGLGTIWLVAIGACMTDLFYAKTQTAYINGVETSLCGSAYPTIRIESECVLSNVLITYPIPIAILVFSYTSIAWKLYHRTSPGNADAERDLYQRQSTIKVIKMLVVIVVVFVLCWSPIQILAMLLAWPSGGLSTFGMTALGGITIASFTWFGMCNCFANPIIYSFCNEDFWNDFKFIFEKLFNICRLK